MEFEESTSVICAQTNNVILLLSPTLTLNYGNPAAEQLFPNAIKDCLHKSILPLFDPAQPLHSLLSNAATLENQLREHSPNPLTLETIENQHRLEWRVSRVLNKGHEVKAFVLIGYDVTALHAAWDEKYQLEEMIFCLPGNVYWMNKKLLHVGCNKNVLDMLGMTKEQYVGKTYEELAKSVGWVKGEADFFKQCDEEVLATGLPKYNIEEPPVPHKNGTVFYYLTNRVPIRNKKGDLMGVAGISTDITELKQTQQNLIDEKEKAEKLAIQNAIQQKTLETQKTFQKIANQVAHDIRSPIASLTMILKSCTDIPESERIALREAATRIDDIANSLLKRFKLSSAEEENTVESEAVTPGEETSLGEPLLVSTTLRQLITDKKYEYPQVQWNVEIAPEAHFAFIDIEAGPFKRALSNLINNAVDALPKASHQSGQITLRVETDTALDPAIVRIVVQDNGKGIPPSVLQKINDQIAVTSGKKDGHGIGLTQVRETIQAAHGTLEFHSVLGQGTEVRLTFKRIPAPDWMAQDISLFPNDQVIILDDDTSIHGAWDTHLQNTLDQCPSIQLQHFSHGQEALDFIHSYSETDRKHLFLLSDFELLKQELDGLSIIEKSQLKRALLVTSHSMNSAVRERAEKIGCKILPKQMASEMAITLHPVETQPAHKINEEKNAQTSAKTDSTLEEEPTDILLVDDDRLFLNSLARYLSKQFNPESFESPEALLEKLNHYPKHIKIVTDNQFKNSPYSGKTLAEALHQKGYTQLYLLSGQLFEAGEIPDYVTVILKGDINRLSQLMDKNPKSPTPSIEKKAETLNPKNDPPSPLQRSNPASHSNEWVSVIPRFAHDITSPLAAMAMEGNRLAKWFPALVKGYRLALEHHLMEPAIDQRQLKMKERGTSHFHECAKEVADYLRILTEGVEAMETDIASLPPRSILASVRDYTEKNNAIEFADTPDFDIRFPDYFLQPLLNTLLTLGASTQSPDLKRSVRLLTQEKPTHFELSIHIHDKNVDQNKLNFAFNRFFTKDKDHHVPGIAFCRLALRYFGGDCVAKLTGDGQAEITITFPK